MENWNYNVVVAQRTDCEVCMQSTMKLSVVKVASGGPAWLLGCCWILSAWPGAHPFRKRGVLVMGNVSKIGRAVPCEHRCVMTF